MNKTEKTYEQALNIILNNTKELSVQTISIQDSIGYVLAQDIYSKIEMPLFNKSAMDGYAVRYADIKTIPAKLKCAGIIEAGDNFKNKIIKGECVKIMTGAVVPDATDTVVKVEDTSCDNDYVQIKTKVKNGSNICFKGEDIEKGVKIFEIGKKIFVSDVAVLASCGIQYIKVISKPKVAILNTGGEIMPLGVKLGKGKIYNSNGPQLSALLKADGFDSCMLGIVPDNKNELAAIIKQGLEYDILLISGGVSMGDYDLVPDTLKQEGVCELFHKVKIKPGKPLFFGSNKNTIVFGIPGNPVSNFLAYNIFIQPLLFKIMQVKDVKPCFKQGILDKNFKHKTDRMHFVLANIKIKQGKYYLTPVKCNGSADTFALSKADCFFIAEAGADQIVKGAEVEFLTWKW